MGERPVQAVDGSVQVKEGRSIVQRLDFQTVKRCGYCKSSEPRDYNAMWAHSLTVQDYENLLFRGWNRTGRFLYQPIVNDHWPACCPRYTIRCHALDFQLSKSHKKILRRFIAYLRNGRLPQSSLSFCNAADRNCSKISKNVSRTHENIKKNPDTRDAGQKKTLEDYFFMINNSEVDSQKIKFRVKTMRVETRNLATASFENEYFMYRQYQVRVHGKNERDIISRDQFIRYFCDSPFVNENEGDTSNKDAIYGRYHQLYYLNKKLIAMSVFDVLPTCVASVNFFYCPAHAFLSLGHFRVLREIWLVRQLHDGRHPGIQYYLMGSYISSSKLVNNNKKLRHPGNFSPSHLLCPEKFSWHLLDDALRSKMKDTLFVYRLSSEMPDEEDVSLEHIRIVSRNHGPRVMSYATFSRIMGHLDYNWELEMYARSVGQTCAASMIIFLLNAH